MRWQRTDMRAAAPKRVCVRGEKMGVAGISKVLPSILQFTECHLKCFSNFGADRRLPGWCTMYFVRCIFYRLQDLPWAQHACIARNL